MDRRLREMLPLLAAVFVDLFSFGLMYPVIVAFFAQPSVIRAYGAEGVDIRLSLAFSLFRSACSSVRHCWGTCRTRSADGARC